MSISDVVNDIEEDEPQLTNIEVNRNTDMDFWRNHATANEIRNQLKLRDPDTNYGRLKSRQQLLDKVRRLINSGRW